MPFGIDCASSTTSRVSQLKSNRVSFVCRYLSTPGNPKNITKAEVTALRKAGIAIVVVFETVANRALEGSGAGVADATSAVAQLKAVGLRDDTPVYFAVDFDAQPNQYAMVGHYFQGVSSVLGLHRTGCYGGINIITHLFDNKRIGYGWQTYAWSDGKWDTRAHLQQYKNAQVLAGISCDYDRNIGRDFGQERKVVKKLVGWNVLYHDKNDVKQTHVNKPHSIKNIRYKAVRSHGHFESTPIYKEVIGV